MKKTLTLITLLGLFYASSQVVIEPTFDIIEPKPNQQGVVEFQSPGFIFFKLFAKNYPANEMFIVTTGGKNIDTLYQRDFKNDSLDYGLYIQWGDFRTQAICIQDRCIQAKAVRVITDLNDPISDDPKKYKYYNVYGQEVEPKGLVMRSDGKRMFYE